MNDAEYADRAEDGVISRGQNDTFSWEIRRDPYWEDRVYEALNISDEYDSVDHLSLIHI